MPSRIYGGDGLAYHPATVDDPVGAGEVYFATKPDEAQLTQAFPGYVAAVAAKNRRLVPKSLVIQRLIAAGKIDAAKLALDADASAFARWFASDKKAVYFDDPDALALLNAIGADPAEIMAP